MRFDHVKEAKLALLRAGFEPGDFTVRRSLGLSANVFAGARPLDHAEPLFHDSPRFCVMNPASYNEDGFIAVLA